MQVVDAAQGGGKRPEGECRIGVVGCALICTDHSVRGHRERLGRDEGVDRDLRPGVAGKSEGESEGTGALTKDGRRR